MASTSQPIARLRSVLEDPKHRTPILAVALAVLAFRSRLLTLPADAIQKLSFGQGRTKLSPEELSQALQQIYTKDAEGNRTLLVPTKDGHLGKVCCTRKEKAFQRFTSLY